MNIIFCPHCWKINDYSFIILYLLVYIDNLIYENYNRYYDYHYYEFHDLFNKVIVYDSYYFEKINWLLGD